MAATKNLTDKTVSVHDKDGNVHLIPPGSPFPEWAAPRIRTNPLALHYANQPLQNPPPKPRTLDPAFQPRPVTVTGHNAQASSRPYLNRPVPKQADIADLDDETRPATYEEELTKLQAKYGMGESHDSPGDRTLSEQQDQGSPLFDSLLVGPLEVERKRQEEKAKAAMRQQDA